LGRIARQRIVAFVVAAASSLGAGSASAQAADPQKLAIARTLFDEATAAMARKDYATACPKYQAVVRLIPDGTGASIALGACYEASGRLASAWTTYVEAEAMAGRTNQSARQKEAREHAAKVQPLLARLSVAVPERVRGLPGLAIERDGIAVSSAEWGVPVPVDKGKHVVVVNATGKQRWERTIDILDGAPQELTLEVPADAAAGSGPQVIEPATATPPPPPPPPPIKESPVVVAPPPVAPVAPIVPIVPDAPTEPPSLSHRWQPGLVVRADIDPLNPGVRTAVGVTFGLFDHVEIGASALLGRTMGFEPQITAFVLKGALKPLINVGVPVSFVDGARVGFRGAAGLQWDVNRHFGVFAQIGGGYFVSVPPGYASVVLLPALGVQGRI
jgi:hypothetical protein